MKRCSNCDVDLIIGNIAPHAGKDIYFRPDSGETTVMGFFRAAMKNSKLVDAYMCPKCGKIELYADLERRI